MEGAFGRGIEALLVRQVVERAPAGSPAVPGRHWWHSGSTSVALQSAGRARSQRPTAAPASHRLRRNRKPGPAADGHRTFRKKRGRRSSHLCAGPRPCRCAGAKLLKSRGMPWVMPSEFCAACESELIAAERGREFHVIAHAVVQRQIRSDPPAVLHESRRAWCWRTNRADCPRLE